MQRGFTLTCLGLILSLVLSLILSLSWAAPALADCDSLAQQMDGLGQNINALVQSSNQYTGPQDQGHKRFLALQERFMASSDKAEQLQLLAELDQAASDLLQVLNARVPLLQQQSQAMQQYLSLAQQGVSEGCFPNLDLSQLGGEVQQTQAALDQAAGLAQNVAAARTKIASVRSDIESTAGTSQEPPTVRVVNDAGMDICVHPGGLSGGGCFGPGQERVYKLDSLYGYDDDTGQRLPTRQLVVVGGGYWTGSPYTSYHEMKLCHKQSFKHQSGEVVWRISGGLEEGCSVRGYHQ